MGPVYVCTYSKVTFFRPEIPKRTFCKMTVYDIYGINYSEYLLILCLLASSHIKKGTIAAISAQSLFPCLDKVQKHLLGLWGD